MTAGQYPTIQPPKAPLGTQYKTFPGAFPACPPAGHLCKVCWYHSSRLLALLPVQYLILTRLPAMASDSQYLSLTGTYSSPANPPFTTTHEVQAPLSGTVNPSVPDKTRYLGDLRKAVATMQVHVNKELTSRMEDDKAREAGKNGKPVVDDAKEEENYGEEAQGE